jgi:hypothetical protein
VLLVVKKLGTFPFLTMPCLMYSRGECRKQPIGSDVRTSLGLRGVTMSSMTTFAPCQFDGRIWVGGAAYAGRVQDMERRHEGCAMFVPSPSDLRAGAA